MINEDHRPVLIAIAGPDGSGKTTITSRFLHHEWMENAIYINPDIIAQEKFGDWNSHEAIMKAVDYSDYQNFITIQSLNYKLHHCIKNCRQNIRLRQFYQ